MADQETPTWALGVERHGGLVSFGAHFPSGWEANEAWYDCECRLDGHHWELIYLTGPSAQFVVRCIRCQVPRCGHSNDQDPCILRRHHKPSSHRLLSMFVPDLNDSVEVEKWLAT